MLPVQARIMQSYLLHIGYQNYTVRNMKPWDLLSAYNFEKKQTNYIYLPIGSVDQQSSGHTNQPRYIDTLV